MKLFKKKRLQSLQVESKSLPNIFWNAMHSFIAISLLGTFITFGSLIYVWQWKNHRFLSKQVENLELNLSKKLFKIELLELEVNYLTRPERLKSFSDKISYLDNADVENQISYLSIGQYTIK